MNQRLAFVPVISLCACAGAITALGGTLTVDDAEMAGLTDEQKAPFRSHEVAEAKARKELEARRVARVTADRDVEIAEWAIRREEASQKIAELRFEGAQSTKNADAMLPARVGRDEQRHAVEVAKAEHAYREAEENHREALVDEAEAALEFAVAVLQLERMKAVLASHKSPTPEDAERLASFEKQVADRKAALTNESASAAETHEAIASVEQTWRTAKEKQPAEGGGDKTEATAPSGAAAPAAKPNPETEATKAGAPNAMKVP